MVMIISEVLLESLHLVIGISDASNVSFSLLCLDMLEDV